MKAGDQFTVPVCAYHHDELHRQFGNERAFWEHYKLDAIALAESFWRGDVTAHPLFERLRSQFNVKG